MNSISKQSLSTHSIARRRTTFGGTGPPKLTILYQPTYRLKPKRFFDKEKTRKKMIETMERNLSRFVYDPQEAIELAQRTTDEIKTLIKRANYDRCLSNIPLLIIIHFPKCTQLIYKLIGFNFRIRIICSLIIGENQKQGVEYTAKNLWDVERDCFIEHVISTTQWFAVGTLFAVYYD